MSGKATDSDVLVSWYRDRIADPTTNDEVYGYWIFVFGVLLGILGILLYLTSYPNPGSFPGRAGIGLSGVALVLLMVGPVIRLPLERVATLISYAGALVAFLGVVWFLLEYPGWRDQREPIITLYAFGLVLIAAGAALVPIVRGSGSPADADSVPPTDSTSETAAATPETAATSEAAPPTESKARFEVYEDRGGKWRWRLRHRNGNIIADGGQGYSSRQKATQGLESVQKNAGGADVVREQPDADEIEDPAVTPYPPGESQGTFEVYEDRGGKWRWRLVHDNGNIVADGGQGYASRDEAEDAVDRVQGYVGDAQYLRFEPAGFEVYRDNADEWRWRLVARNGEIIADGGEGYASRSGARDGIESVRETATSTDAFEVYEDNAGEYRWRLEHRNGEILADSGEGYASRSAANDAVERIVEYAPDADALDYGEPAFELYEDKAMEYRWRLVHDNGKILADSGEGYASRSGARHGIHSVKRNAPNAEQTTPDFGADDDDAPAAGED